MFVNEPTIMKPMKRYYIEDYVITRLNNILEKQYESKYLITINGDIVCTAPTLKYAKEIIELQCKKECE